MGFKTSGRLTMNAILSRRNFVQTLGIGASAIAGATVSSAQESDSPDGDRFKILAIACSARQGKTTAQALTHCLEAALAVNPQRIETELIELANLEIPAQVAVGLPLKPGQQDDFPALADRMVDPRVAAIIIGTPVYFGSMTALCKSFLDRCISLRQRKFALANRIGGVVAVGGVRNGGQELTIQCVQTALLCQEMIIVGDGRATCHTGATVWNNGQDDIAADEFGLTTVKNLGRRVAEVALSRLPAQP
jgi:multimeric flavodoxin WrbA